MSRASPLLGRSCPAMMRSRLDFPAPLGPTTPILAQGRKESVTSSSTTLSPCALLVTEPSPPSSHGVRLGLRPYPVDGVRHLGVLRQIDVEELGSRQVVV